MNMITLKNYLKRYLNDEEKGKFIRNVKRFKSFYRQNKNKPAIFMLLKAFDFNFSDEGNAYWQEKLARINDVVVIYHSIGTIKSIIPVLHGKTHKFCYFFNEKGDLIEIIEHSVNNCNLVYKK